MSPIRLPLIILFLTISNGLNFNWTVYHSNPEIELILGEINRKCHNISFMYHLRTNDAETTVNGNKLFVLAFGKSSFVHKLGIAFPDANCWLLVVIVFLLMKLSTTL